MNLATDYNPGHLGLSRTAIQLLALREPVMAWWERETRARVEGAAALLRPVLTNALPAFLDNIAEALSPHHPRADATSHTNAAAVHGGERARMTNFGPEQVVHEYQILREAIAAETKGRVALTDDDWAVIDRSINSAIREAVREFSSIQEDLRRKLAGALSHDMRTPLANIATAADLIKLTKDYASTTRYADKVQSNAHRLEHMMSELLDALTYNGSDKLPLTLERFDIADLVNDICGEHRKPSKLVFDLRLDSVQGHWCRAALRRALENLINNAVKYGDGARVSISTASTRGRLMISIHNMGSVIDKKRFGDIFDYYTRGAHGSEMGWGLGLPFVKRVAESHGGSVAVDSSKAMGTTFLIDIPLDCRPFAQSEC